MTFVCGESSRPLHPAEKGPSDAGVKFTAPTPDQGQRALKGDSAQAWTCASKELFDFTDFTDFADFTDFIELWHFALRLEKDFALSVPGAYGMIPCFRPLTTQ